MTKHTPSAEQISPTAIAFSGVRKIAIGSILEVALASKTLLDQDGNAPLLILEYLSSEVIELDLRGSAAQVTERLGSYPLGQGKHDSHTIEMSETAQSEQARGRGRPKLGVMAREVTLLPRHWQWLAEQPGGASVTLRKLVEHARNAGAKQDLLRTAQESAYRFMAAVAGDFPGFEKASRALFAPEPARFTRLVSQWPNDVGTHALTLASYVFDATMTVHKNQDTLTCAI